MAPRKRREPGAEATENSLPVADKIARLLALMVVRDMETKQAALKLDSVGFSAHDISLLLGVNSNYVHKAKHEEKGGAKKKRAKKAAS